MVYECTSLQSSTSSVNCGTRVRSHVAISGHVESLSVSPDSAVESFTGGSFWLHEASSPSKCVSKEHYVDKQDQNKVSSLVKRNNSHCLDILYSENEPQSLLCSPD